MTQVASLPEIFGLAASIAAKCADDGCGSSELMPSLIEASAVAGEPQPVAGEWIRLSIDIVVKGAQIIWAASFPSFQASSKAAHAEKSFIWR